MANELARKHVPNAYRSEAIGKNPRRSKKSATKTFSSIPTSPVAGDGPIRALRSSLKGAMWPHERVSECFSASIKVHALN